VKVLDGGAQPHLDQRHERLAGHSAVYTLTVAIAVPDFTLGLTPHTISLTPKFRYRGRTLRGGHPRRDDRQAHPRHADITGTTAVSTTYVLTVPANAPKSSSTLTFTASSGVVAKTATAAVTIS
jgi:hypothetical protein